MTFRLIDPAAAGLYYAEEADRPITTTGIPDGSLVIFTDSGLEDSFDGQAVAWFNREQLAQDSKGNIALNMLAPDGVANGTFREVRSLGGSLGQPVTGNVFEISAIQKAFQLIIPPGAIGTLTIEGSADPVNFEQLIPPVSSSGLFISQQPLRFFRVVTSAFTGLPATFTTITIAEVTVDADKIEGIEDIGKYYELSGTGIGTGLSTVGNYMQLSAVAGGQFQTDWNNIPFVIYEVVDANTIRIFDPTGDIKDVSGSAVGIFQLAYAIGIF